MLRRLTIVAFAIWTAVIAGSLVWNLRLTGSQIDALAYKEAVANFNKDQAFRLWGTRHGGVYVPVTPDSPPSPYLSHLPERDLTTPSGRQLTLLNPNYMVRQMTEHFETLYGIKGHITGLTLLRPENVADSWETEALRSFTRGEREAMAQAEIAGEPYLRLMRPMIMEEGCMPCHGHLGFKVGEVRGGVGVAVPLAPYLEQKHRMDEVLWLSHTGIWMLGLGGIAVAARQIGRRMGEAHAAEQAASRLNAELEKRVEERTSRLRTLSRVVEQSPDIVIVTNRQGMIEYVNPTFQRITGYTAGEAVGKTPAMIRSVATPPQISREIWNAITAGQEWHGELQDTRRDGSPFWVDTAILPVRDEQDVITHFVALQRDVTERKLAEAELLRAKDAAELANKAKSEIMANMSHELRTPLNAIIGYSDALLEGICGDFKNPRQREYIADIHHSGEHLLELINDVLDVAAIEAGMVVLHPEPLDVAAICTTCLRLMRPRADKAGVALSLNAAAELPRLFADQRRVKQILLNLLSNSVKFTPRGGSVDLRARLDGSHALVLSVADTGIGMTPDEVAVALMPFGQVDSSLSRKYEGTGLGLPLTVDLATLHGGSIKIDSTKGFGTTISVVFPPERTMAPDAVVSG